MSTYTTHYEFEKPEGTDLLSPDSFNDNFDAIDTELYRQGLATAVAQPWIELVNYEETNFSGGFTYRNFTDQSYTLDYFDKLFLMIYFKGSATNTNSSESKNWYLRPAFSVNGVRTYTTDKWYTESVPKSSTENYEMYRRDESKMISLSNSFTLDKPTRFLFAVGKISATSDGIIWGGDPTGFAYYPLSWDVDANGFGVLLSASTGITMSVETLKVALYGQRTYGNMRF